MRMNRNVESINNTEEEEIIMDRFKNIRDIISNMLSEDESAQNVLSYLISQIGEFDLSKDMDFISFEVLFYHMIATAYAAQRNSAQTEELITLEPAQKILDEKHYQYLSLIYDIVQLQFWWWLNCRALYSGESYERSEKLGVSFKQTFPEDVGTKALWSKILELAESAHALVPIGELANRFMFIADVQLIYGVGNFRYEENPDNMKLVKYYYIRDGFIRDCYNNSYSASEYRSLNDLPHFVELAEVNNPKIAYDRTIDEKSYYEDIMTFPIIIEIEAEKLNDIIIKKGQGRTIEKQNQELKRKNEELKKKNEELEKTIAELNRIKADRERLIEAHVHNWTHYTYPATIKEVADYLSTSGDIEHACMLHNAYHSEQYLHIELKQLQWEYLAEDKYKLFYDSIKKSDSYFSKTVDDILKDALQLVLFRFVMEGKDKSDFDMESIRASYQSEFLGNKKDAQSPEAWFSERLFPLTVEWKSELWKLPRFSKNQTAYLRMVGIFINIFHNAINHGKKTKDGFLKIVFDEEKRGEQLYLTVTASNPDGTGTEYEEGNGKGLQNVKSDLENLNSVCAERIGAEWETDEECFTLKLYFSEKLLIRRA